MNPAKMANIYDAKIEVIEGNNVLGPQEFQISGFSPLSSGGLEVDRAIEGGKFEKTFYAPGKWQKLIVIGDLPKAPPQPKKPDVPGGKDADAGEKEADESKDTEG